MMKRKRGHSNATKALATLGALAALAGGCVAISGCGASATLDPIARAAEVTSQQSGAKIAMRMRFSSAALPGGSDIAITANGYIDERDRSGQLTMDMSGIPGLSSLPGGGSSIRMVFKYPLIYMNMPFLAGKLPEGKTWMKLDVSKVAQAAGLGSLSSLEQTEDPTKFLDYLRASSGVVVSLGKDEVDGVSTTHYSATLQLSHIVERLPGDQRTAAKAALEKLGSGSGIPVEVWVDELGRVRRMQMTFGAPAGSAGASAGSAGASGLAAAVSGSITLDFKSYGAVPPIVAPPANEVFDASSLAASGVQNGG
jgi:hypothetical protein